MSKAKPKRVVSKAEYRRYLRKKIGLFALWGGLLLCLLVGSISIGELLERHLTTNETVFWSLLFLVGGPLIICAVFLVCDFADKKIQRLEPVEPVSHHNIDRLPAAEALVRVSDAPQTPEAVLLRAAQEQETPQEQLLRAAE